MTLVTYDAPAEIATSIATTLRDLGYLEDAVQHNYSSGVSDNRDTFPSSSNISTRFYHAGPDQFLAWGSSGAQEPKGGFASDGARRTNSSNQGRLPPAGPAAREGVALARPFVVRTLPNDVLLEPDWLCRATVTGWRYLVENAPIAVDFRLSRGEAGKVTRGALVQRLGRATKLAEQRFGEDEATYHVGILEVPALHVSALSIEGAADLHFLTYRDPTPDQSLTIETSREFGIRLARILRKMAADPGAVDTSYLENVTTKCLAPVAMERQTAAAGAPYTRPPEDQDADATEWYGSTTTWRQFAWVALPARSVEDHDTFTVAGILNVKGNSVVSVDIGETVGGVVAVMSTCEMGAVLCIDQQHHTFGIVSERDLIDALASKGTAALAMTVGEFMTRDVVTATPRMSVLEAMSIMTTHRFSHLPVVENRQLVGLVSLGDLVTARMRAARR